MERPWRIPAALAMSSLAHKHHAAHDDLGLGPKSKLGNLPRHGFKEELRSQTCDLALVWIGMAIWLFKMKYGKHISTKRQQLH